MKLRARPRDKNASSKPWKALVLAVALGFIAGVGQVAEPLELMVKALSSKLHLHPASGQIVLVAVDDRSIAELGPAPWNGNRLAELLNRTRLAGARSIHFDAELPGESESVGADQLEAAMRAAAGRLTLPARFSIDPATEQPVTHVPHERYARHALLVNTNIRVHWDGAVWRHPYAAEVDGQRLPSLAAYLANVRPTDAQLFAIDYSVDRQSLPVVSASDVLAGRVPPQALAGRHIVIGRTDFPSEHYRTPGSTAAPKIMFHVLAAETLRRGTPADAGWGWPLLLTAFAAAGILFVSKRSIAGLLILSGGTAALIAPYVLQQQNIHVEVFPALIALVSAAVSRLVKSIRRAYEKRGTTNIISGLPNLQALRQVQAKDGAIIVVARVKNYAQVTSTLAPQHEKELVDQIVARLHFGTGGALLYQSDDGVFIWVATDRQEESVVQQIEALNALFRSPIVVATRLIDLAVTFGIDLDSTRAIVQRVPSALLAAEEAAREGKRWATFNTARLEDVEWAMSLLARLDTAIDTGELWVAYQPKVDCETGYVVGAEALVRWTHPEKGQIYPDQFIGAAEEGGRIERLTHFVLDQALAATASIHRHDGDFSVAVNLSALLLGDARLVVAVSDLLRKHGVPPAKLTLEVTETSTMGSAEEALANLHRLAALGVKLSIDDYGTGFSTLEYLRRIPASELKIDRSFISMLHKSQSDRIMVNSTIQLAHSLGRKVVAEGVENEEILAELQRMGCDLVQGYHLGRPMPLPQLIECLSRLEKGRAAA